MNFKIKTLYSDNGGEFIKLRNFLQANGISHLTTPPHNPEHNGHAEHKHHHLTKTAKCLLYHDSLPFFLFVLCFSNCSLPYKLYAHFWPPHQHASSNPIPVSP
ncbi:hypothetical protein V8G54_026849 [Vigna mungo]|uniref:Integrase catalytic domain-containing protein n=1 Tax=Vigna mungo TaxID=3915 RepID=A0AAQ3MZH6_VIGMU